MLLWIKLNLSTIIVCIVLMAAVAAIIKKMVKDKRQGKSSCGCQCQGCSMYGSCHKQK